ncbi:MAG TPA: glutamate racemase, partial [Clostridium sp.]|nr:glutamate racemase [Clostridium sp.]
MESEDRPIGFFDSGIGGISVLREAVKILSNENFVYFGDSKRAPYGTRTVENVRE